MAANTTDLLSILMFLAQAANEIKGDYVTAYDASTLKLTLKTLDGDDDAYNYGLASILGKGTVQISDWTKTGKYLYISVPFSSAPVAGNGIDIAFIRGDRRKKALNAVNAAIRQSYPDWYREVKQDSTSATLTFAAGTYSYALPAGVTHLARAGIQETNCPVTWFDRQHGLWNVSGQEGALTVEFHSSPRGWSLPDAYNTYDLCLWYEQREPELTVDWMSGSITGAASNGAANLIRITSAAHGLATGQVVTIAGVSGTTEANGTWTVTAIAANTFDLQASVFTNAFSGSGGTWRVSGGTGFTTQLPLDFFNVAVDLYRGRFLLSDSGAALQTDNVALPQLQLKAREALARNGMVKEPLDKICRRQGF